MLKHLRRSHLDDQDDIQCPRCKDKVKIDNVVKHLESCEKFGKFIETMAAFQCSLCAAENQEIRFFNTEDMFKHFTAEHSVFCHFLSKLSNRPNQNDQQGQGMVDKKHIFQRFYLSFIKFSFSEKATKICAIILMILTFT